MSALGGRRVALIFYPWAFSSICTSELTEVRDSYSKLVEREIIVLALSCDPMFALRAYADAERLPFDLLTDWWPHGRISSQYGVFDAERGCALRGTFGIDAAGQIDLAAVSEIGERRDILTLLG